ncbi:MULTISPECIES: hypothetical protein [Caballeronia]|uniref:hypothetical protein n=1 Tax=Caballeronia TaxID=1827195 RepID=UPI001EF718EF|nr:MULTISPECIES: hypothetical protein [Caballeronia]MCG7400479.1 hypothetical protein [Caballeronia zhejiangensis]
MPLFLMSLLLLFLATRKKGRKQGIIARVNAMLNLALAIVIGLIAMALLGIGKGGNGF